MRDYQLGKGAFTGKVVMTRWRQLICGGRTNGASWPNSLEEIRMTFWTIGVRQAAFGRPNSIRLFISPVGDPLVRFGRESLLCS
jgi:hypothetical protein